ncbi:unnamed protein product [Soboliphyme baturini]|uniref:Laminin EGF-like domain-containing protein n=1 Tax=Soboliphyme baturini TaxID=241478 RepID=A0A183IPC4_9BILA|nr:unnamed protein product [Soboliphyme baturini]
MFFSATCRSTYGLADKAPILPTAETVAQCSSDYADISPLTGGNVAFSTLEGRPSAHRFESSPVLQEWVTASEIMVSLNRLNTFGDEVFRDDGVLRSYYYAIADFAVGGRCKCNGHAGSCVKTKAGGEERLFCQCEHNTQGEDCHECLTFYNDMPWKAATAEDGNECKRSASLQCASDGRCICKPGVGGIYCDQCLPGYYEFSHQGCRHCGCVEAGSLSNKPNCRSDTGDCSCKKNVEGRRCDRCKPGFFNLDMENEFGCSPCFCYGHTSVCDFAPGFYEFNISSDFTRGKDGWTAVRYGGNSEELQYNVQDGNIMVREVDGPTYFVASDKFVGNQRSSYDQHLIFKLKVTELNARASIRDVVIEGGNGQLISLPIFAQNNPVPANYEQTYTYRLHEDPRFQWTPSLSTMEFLTVLSNLSAIKIRGTFVSGDVGMLDSVVLVSASNTESNSPQAKPAKWVESCQCPDGFVGQFCESCAPGFRREPQYGGPFGRCIKCQCHNHATLCDAESGRCICEHNTAGNNCERCARGFYGNALNGSAEDCRVCPCPNNGPCILHTDGDIICIDCPNGYGGRRCDACADGFFGDPISNLSCQLCECSGNIDQNSVGNCDRLTGECKKCVYNTYGFHCEKCLPGFYGDALLEPKGDCKPCKCFPPGTQKTVDSGAAIAECEQSSGQCSCLKHVVGLRCDRCEPGYFNISSGNGCQMCNCDPLGSTNTTCDVMTGQCICKPGVVGLRCDQCAPRHFGFSPKGCDSCQCFPTGSTDLQCDVATGQCTCRPNVEGRQCDRCEENMYNLQAGCIECPPCYKLIQKHAHEHRAELKRLRSLLNELVENPLVVNDTNFDSKLKFLKELMVRLEADVKEKLTDSPMMQQLPELRADIATANETLSSVVQMLAELNKTLESSKQTMLNWENIKEMAYTKFVSVKSYLENQALEAWTAAKEASEHFGRQSEELTKLAEHARNLAEKQKNESLLVEENAMKALNISKAALQKAKEAIYGAEVTSSEIGRLEKRYMSAEKLYNQTAQMALEQSDRSNSVYQKSAEILNKVDSLELPSIDVSNVKKKAELISGEAKAVKEEAQKLAADNKPMTNEIARFNEDMESELEKAEQQQQIADGLLAEIDSARAKASRAVQLADSTLKEANNTLHTLEGMFRFVFGRNPGVGAKFSRRDFGRHRVVFI